MKQWLKQLFCKHSWYWNRNIYGDEIVHRNYKRSEWYCAKCEAVQYRDKLVES
jgi:hypothetical protein